MSTRAVNLRFEEYDEYIGRGSEWGNLWSHKKSSQATYIVATREDAVRAHRFWVNRRLELGEPGLVEKIRALKGKRLGCYCKPAACHGDTLAELADLL